MNSAASIMLSCYEEAGNDIRGIFKKSKELEKICKIRNIKVVADYQKNSDLEPNKEGTENMEILQDVLA